MKIGGRTIQDRNISINTETQFSATYKQHYIEVKLYQLQKGTNPEWSIDIWHFKGGFAVETIKQSCTIRDAIIYGLNGALL